ncbi:DUF423 domain-containing protein [Suttonella sp. R2A3]|uniref:DUF423 domain-containing protein n=1 Tax=Suttonella sp. R2A3 TaxID=2908648 RepID=UPI001F19B5FD|nr:DUF423 domain-containing protein [Suttonella sp. R2A3]UJF25176.1 DUF423 domain-containing protein [Suttonella sp. R2A3]
MMDCQQNTDAKWLLLAAISGFLWVSLGAATGHGMLQGQSAIYFEKAQRYHIIHTLFIGLLAVIPALKWRVWIAGFWLLGMMIFSGCLYLMAVWDLPLNALVPIGGVSFLLGWATLIYSAYCLGKNHGD